MQFFQLRDPKSGAPFLQAVDEVSMIVPHIYVDEKTNETASGVLIIFKDYIENERRSPHFVEMSWSVLMNKIRTGVALVCVLEEGRC
jgi:hypothetical protein